MRIKNTKLLRQRANAHAKHDRIEQGTYGRASVNGHATFRGCAIGCLTTPHTQKGLRDFLRKIFNGAGDDYLDEYGWGEDEQRKALAKEFGICRALAFVLESLFESQPTHGAAIEFIPKFARALPEGANITPSQVRKAFPECIDSWDDDSYKCLGGAELQEVMDRFFEFLRSKKVGS